MRRLRLAALLIAALIAVPLLVRAAGEGTNVYKELSFFGDVFQLVQADYVDPVDTNKLVAAALNGMLTSLDPHSGYLDPTSYSEMQVETKGEFGGLGMEVTMKDGLVQVVSPIDDTPASRAAMQAGDIIIAIDGSPVLGLSLSEAVEKLRGPKNSTVRLTIRRGAAAPFELTLTREVIKVHPAHWKLYGKIGYLRVSIFSELADSEVRQALDKMRSQAHDKLQGLVLDLRDDPGGLLDQAIAVSGDFLDRGQIVSTRGRHPQDNQQYNSHGDDLISGVPIVVLINGGTASASEIVAGALHDNHRAVLMGVRSFGKGTVQTIIPIPGHGAVRLTTARYYTPSGRSIQEVGIEPDIVVQVASAENANELKPIRERDLPRALKNPDAGSPDKTDKEASDAVARIPAAAHAPTTPASNVQLDRALDYLRGNVTGKTGTRTP